MHLIPRSSSFLNHENSRKHKDFVQLLKAHMEEENETLLSNPPAEEDEETVALPVNNAPRFVFSRIFFREECHDDLVL